MSRTAVKMTSLMNGESPDDDDDDDGRKKHVEVCVRIRPLAVGKLSSSSFFHKKTSESNGSSSSKHKSAFSRKATTPPRSGLRKPQLPRAFRRKDKPASPKVLNDEVCAWNVVSEDTVKQSEHTDIVQGRTHTYTLDRVYGPKTNTQQLYEESVQNLVHAAMDGYHASVLAYGQTSTGKTHTMTGTAEQPGLIPLCMQECFRYLNATDQPREYLLRVSYLEVYKEHIRDLLATHAVPVRLFDSGADGLVIKGLREEIVTSPQEVFDLLTAGEARRQVGATHMNQHSSRSHVLVRIWIESRDAGSRSNKGVRVSSLSLVDLAGSESVRLTGSTERQKEGHYINQSLMTLGKVVYALSESDEKTKKHVPYRDSKLTRLLQPSLSGNAQVVLLCCVSPLTNHLEESHNTFKFASRAKKIPQKAVIQETADEKTLLEGYREEIEDLKQQLLEARQQQEQYKSLLHSTPGTTPDSSLHSRASSSELVSEGEITELVEAISTMEKLILKSNPAAAAAANPEDLLDLSEALSDGNEEADLMALVSNGEATPARAPPHKTPKPDKEMQNGLSRVQGLLGSVLKRRMGADQTEKEIRHLRDQLEEQQAATSLRQADASFLQAQLEEKDKLLQEVSKILEAVEDRQARLEAENEGLRRELAIWKQHADLPSNHRTQQRLEF